MRREKEQAEEMRGTSAGDSGRIKEEDHDEELEESLSLCDLPINESENLHPTNEFSKESQQEEDFDFNFFNHILISKDETEMCVADEVFFQGQILPLRHSVSCDGDSGDGFARIQTKYCFSRSDSSDHSSYSGGLTSASSRSSSINSHHSSSSATSSATSATARRPPRIRNRNQFQYSHPSPKPQIRSSSSSSSVNSNRNSTSGFWSILRVGLMTPPPGIAIKDLKNRSSRNTTSINVCNYNSTPKRSNSKQKPFFLNKNGAVLFGGCKCSASSVGPNPSAIRTKSGSGSKESENMTKNKQEKKQEMSRHRTFEWLKQLSLEEEETG